MPVLKIALWKFSRVNRSMRLAMYYVLCTPVYSVARSALLDSTPPLNLWVGGMPSSISTTNRHPWVVSVLSLVVPLHLL